jgi:hypothetical protein
VVSLPLLACAAVTLAALLYVFWFAPEPVRAKTQAEREREYLEEKRAVLYENLRDLNLEYRMGKLSDLDYNQTKTRYQQELALLLQEFEQKTGAPAPSAQPPEPLPASEPRPVPGRCARCGHDNPVQNRFCGACGAELPRHEFPA